MSLFSNEQKKQGEPALGDCLCQLRGEFLNKNSQPKYSDPEEARYPDDIKKTVESVGRIFGDDKCCRKDVTKESGSCNCGTETGIALATFSEEEKEVLLDAVRLILSKVDNIERALLDASKR